MEFQRIMWIRMKQQADAGAVRKFVSALGKQFPGNVPVRLYAPDAQAAADMDNKYCLSENAVTDLERKYGADNVKLVRERIFPEDDHGIRLETLMAVERIADALEKIESHLTDTANRD